jgi:hypothetical protein
MNEKDIAIKTLVEYGLSNAEAEIYLICLNNKDITPYEISKLVDIPRTTIYDIVMNLALKQLITLKQSDGFTKQQTNLRAKNPSILRKLLREKREKLFRLEDKVIDIMPFLKQDFHSTDQAAHLHFFDGVEGARKIYFEESKEPFESEVLVWSYLISDDLLGAEAIQNDLKVKRENRERGFGNVKTIIPLSAWTKHCVSYQYAQDKDYIKYNQFRYIEQGLEDFINRISIKNDTVRIISAEEDDIWGLKFESPSLAKSLRAMHKLMWLSAKPLTSEIVESFGVNEFWQYKHKDKVSN